jgi:ABC-type transporter Mla subunit MlaD
MLGLPSLGAIAGWGRAVAEEIGRLPQTLHDARVLLADIPARLDALVAALDTTTAALERVLPELERTTIALERILGDVSGVIGGMDGRLQNLDTTVAELGRVAVTLIEGIPGVRRVLRRRTHPS